MTESPGMSWLKHRLVVKAGLLGALICLLAFSAALTSTGNQGPSDIGVADGDSGRVFDLPETVHQVEYGPGGDTIAVGGVQGTAWILDPEDGDILQTFVGHEAGVVGLDVSSDGSKLATTSSDGTSRVWDVVTGEELLSVRHSGATADPEELLYSVVFSPDGANIATSGSDGTVRVWSILDGQELAALAIGTGAGPISYGPSGTRIVTGTNDGTAFVWSLPSEQKLLTLDGHSQRVFSTSFSPDGELLATGGGEGTTVVWNLDTGEQMSRLSGPAPGVVFAAEFAPDGSRLAVASVGEVRVWSMDDFESTALYPGLPWEVFDLDFSPDGEFLASVNPDGALVVHHLD